MDVGAHRRAPAVEAITNMLGTIKKNETAAMRRDASPGIEAFFNTSRAPKGRRRNPRVRGQMSEVRCWRPVTARFGARRARQVRGGQGITLLELLVVITLLAIVGALVYPSFGNAISNLRLRGAGREVVAVCRLAKYEAITHRQPFRLAIDLEKNQIGVTDSALRIIKELELPPGVRIFQAQVVSEKGPADASELYFFPNGAAEAGSITLRDDGGRSVKIVIDLLTGDARISD
jgi:general secretion pathway protein H